MVELKMKRIFDEKPHNTNALDRSVNHPLIKKLL